MTEARPSPLSTAEDGGSKYHAYYQQAGQTAADRFGALAAPAGNNNSSPARSTSAELDGDGQGQAVQEQRDAR